MKKLSSVTISGGLTVDQATTLSGVVSVGGIGTGAYTSVLVRNSSNQMLYRNYSDFVNDISGSLNLSGYVPTSRTLTINGTTYDLSADRTWTINTVAYTSRLQHQVKAGVAINKGQAVYVTSADGTNMIVGLASNTSEATSSKTMGLLDATVSTNGFANVVTEGLLAGLDTSTAGTEGDPVWLGTGGNLIYGLANKPYAPAHLVFIGIVTRKNANNGEIFVKVQNGFELKEIHDVDLITTVPVNGHILGYNGTLWVNKTIAGWLGYTPANASGTTNYISKFTGSTTLGNSQIYDDGSNVGIGTTTMYGKLSISSGNSNGIRIDTNGGGYSALNIGGTGALTVDAPGITGGRFQITDSGNVGIGTPSPNQKLHIKRTETVNRTTYTDILTIDADANNSPYTGHGGGILFRGTTYSGSANNVQGNRIWGRIGMFLNDFYDGFNGESMFFAVAPDDRSDALTTAMTIQYNGNVGIGTTSPGYKLHVAGDILSSGSFRLEGGGASVTYISEGWGINLNGDGTHPVQIPGSSLSVGYTLGGGVNYGSGNAYISGSVGIGTNNPGYKLDIIGVTRFQDRVRFAINLWNLSDDGYNRLYFANGGRTYYGSGDGHEWRSAADTSIGFLTNAGNLILKGTNAFTTGGTATLSVIGDIISLGSSNNDLAYFRRLGTGQFQWQTYNSGNNGEIHLQPYGGNVGIGTSNPMRALNIVSNNAQIRISDSTAPSTNYWEFSSVYFNTNQDLFISNQSVTALTINSLGNVGIGTTSPSYKLDVSGTARFTQSISLNQSAVIKKRFDSGTNNPVKTSSGVLTSRSDNASGSTYYVIETNVPQDEYQMGGFTIELFGNYSSTNHKTKIDLGGYWNPEGNGGFIGFEAHGSNPQYKPTIEVARNTSTGNTAFIIYGLSWNYPVIVARDLWLGYNGTDGGAYGEGWSIIGTETISGYSNRDTVVWRNAYSDSNPAGYITGYTETDTLQSVTSRGATTNTLVSLNAGLRMGNAYLTPSGDQNHFHFDGTAIIPNSSTTANNASIGTNTYRWSSVYGGYGYFSENVGIGTTSPATKFHVHGYTTIDSVDVVATFSSDNTAKRVNIGYSTSGDYGFINAVHTGVAWKNLIFGVNGGNIGIGLTNPTAILHTSGNTKLGGGTLQVSTDQTFLSNYSYTFRDAVGINNPNSLSAASATTVMSIGSMTNGVSLITTGSIGVGTTSPSTALDVNGNILSNSTLYAGSTNNTRISIDSGTIYSYYSNEANARVAISRDVFYGGQAGIGFGGGGTFAMIGDGGATNGSSLAFSLSAGIGNGPSNEKMRLTSTGLGIGTASPSEKLHVSGAAIFDGGSGNSSTDSVVYITKSTNDDWGLYVNNAGLDYGMYTRTSPSANYAFAIHNGTTWTTRITGNAIVYLGEKNAIEGNYDSWLRLNNSNHYASGVYTPGVMRADGGFNVNGNTVWHAANDGSGSGLDADLLDGQDSSVFLRLLPGGAEASLDSYTDNGVRSVSFAGHSQHLLSWNAGGSTGTVQQLFHYGTPNNGWRIRNKTDNSSWSDWGYVVMASSNQGLISGTIATQSWVGSQSYATTSYVTTQINNLINGAPGALDTLDELAAALGDDSNFATTVTNSIAGKVSKSGDTMTGNLTLAGGTNILFTGGSHAIAGNNTGYLHFYDYTNVYFNNQLVIRGGIQNDGGNVLIDDNLNVNGELAFPDGAGAYSNIIRSAPYPSEGYPSGLNFWMEYRAKGGHHFILNTDGGVGAGLASMDDFVIWQGAIDGNRLLEVSNIGNLWIAGALTEASSFKLKENIETSEGNLEKVVNLRPVNYNKIGSQTTELGLIAEEVAEVYPEFVQYDENGEPVGVHYSRLTAALIGAVKELTNQVQELNKKING